MADGIAQDDTHSSPSSILQATAQHANDMAAEDVTKKCEIMAMPPELRLNIYDHYFASFKLDVKAKNTVTSKKRALTLALLAASKLIRKEALGNYQTRLEALVRQNDQKLWTIPKFPGFNSNAKGFLEGLTAHLVGIMTHRETKLVYCRELVKVQEERNDAADPALIESLREQEEMKRATVDYESVEWEDWPDV